MLGERWSPNYVLIEDAASGQSLIQLLMKENVEALYQRKITP